MNDKTETAPAKDGEAAKLPAGVKTVALPSGRSATVKKGKGKHLRAAGRHANPAQDPMGYAMALAAQLVEIDGNPVLPEDLDEMDMDDVQAIMGAMPGKSQLPAIPSSS